MSEDDAAVHEEGSAAALDSLWADVPEGMIPTLGFNSDDRPLLDTHGFARVTTTSPEGVNRFEIPGRWQFALTMRPTPHVAWRFEADTVDEALADPDAGAVLNFRPPLGPDLDLMTSVRGWHITSANVLWGKLAAYELAGDIQVREVRFEVINWGDVIGALSTCSREPLRMTLNRHRWSSAGWQITLDGDPELQQSWAAAKQQRGFTVTHCGCITRSDGLQFSFRECLELLRCLHFFLSFVRGRRVGVALATGYGEATGAAPQANPLATHWGHFVVDEAASSQSWFTTEIERELAGLFRRFHEVWSGDQPLARRLMTMIGTYCVALNESIPIDMRILAGYIGLETETKESLHQQNLKRILAYHGLPHLIKDAVGGSSTPFNGPKLLAKTRNQIVHQDGGSELTTDKLGRAWNTALYFLELVILRKLGHDGSFCDRFQATWAGMRSPMPDKPQETDERPSEAQPN